MDLLQPVQKKQKELCSALGLLVSEQLHHAGVSPGNTAKHSPDSLFVVDICTVSAVASMYVGLEPQLSPQCGSSNCRIAANRHIQYIYNGNDNFN